MLSEHPGGDSGPTGRWRGSRALMPVASPGRPGWMNAEIHPQGNVGVKLLDGENR